MRFILEDGKNEEKLVRLKLEQDDDGDVTLVGTDNDGIQWHIAQFKEGRFELISDISDDVGIKVDKNGKIREKKS